jgi:hypothetical protein
MKQILKALQPLSGYRYCYPRSPLHAARRPLRGRVDASVFDPRSAPRAKKLRLGEGANRWIVGRVHSRGEPVV